MDLKQRLARGYRMAQESVGLTGELPRTWEEREKWLRTELAGCRPEVIQKEIEFHRASFEREQSALADQQKSEEIVRNALEKKSEREKETFLRDLYRRPL